MSHHVLFPEDLDHVLHHTRDLWDELRGQRLFITGGTGFVGTWLVESFVWATKQLGSDSQAVILSRNPGAFLAKAPHLAGHPALSFHVGNQRDFDFPTGSFSHVIHAAVDSRVRQSTDTPLLLLDNIVQGTRHVLDFAVQCDARKFLLTSSGAVYGRHPPELTHIPEDYVGAPDSMDAGSAYGHGKRLAEHCCALYAHQYGIESKIARGFTFVGPHLPLKAQFAIGNFIRDGLRGGPILINGDGTARRSYLHAADLTIWLWTILFRGVSCRPYNLGSGLAVCIRAVAESVAECIRPRPAVVSAEKPTKSSCVDYVPDVNRARSELGLDVKIDFVQACERTIRWYKASGCSDD